MIQDRIMEPTFIVDISDTFDTKMEAVKCYTSQFHNPDSREPVTYISTGHFMRDVASRDALMGKRIGTRYAEGFVSENTPGLSSLDAIILPQLP
jgi:LmbE family N-acetylglucosaminyl deacetylase